MSARAWAWENMEPDGAAAARLERFVRDLARARHRRAATPPGADSVPEGGGT